MDNNKLAELLFPHITTTPEDMEAVRLFTPRFSIARAASMLEKHNVI